MKRNIRGWIIAAVAAAVLILLLVLWGMRPGRQGQPGQPGQPGHDVKASVAELVLADHAGRVPTSWT
jgi:hypothetical protein